MPLGFRLIDLVSMNVVEPQSMVPFVTLSYMWKQIGAGDLIQLELNNLLLLQTPGALLNIPLPPIISDSIWLCRQLGQQYLWLDRLCIIQDDAHSKHEQISCMDRIYSAASFCIAAALNDRSGSGLPGCPGRPRQESIWAPPRRLKVDGRGILDSGVERLVNSSQWNRRGWTFQERVLSKRCLFITESQVVFECREGEACEEFAYNWRSPISATGNAIVKFQSQTFPAFESKLKDRHGPNFNLWKNISMADYFKLVEDYTSRHLSHSSDILNAFSGVGNVFCRLLDSNSMVFGLPERYIAQALLWSCADQARLERLDLQAPSWSWASLSNKVVYPLQIDLSEERGKAIPDSIWYQDPALGLRKLVHQQGYTPDEESEFPYWRLSPSLAFRPPQASSTIACARYPSSLLFNAMVARVVFKRVPESIQSKWDTEAGLYAESGELVGLLSQAHQAHTLHEQGRVYDVVAVCDSARYIRSGRWKLGSLYHQVHVLLVERLESFPYVARRIDVGRIMSEQWEECCKPRWETVILC